MKSINVFLLALLTIGFVACKKETKKEVQKEIVESDRNRIISTDKLFSLGNDIQLLDVRTPNEFDDGYIKNAINIDIKSGDFIQSTVLLNKSKPVYVYCMAGARSTLAAKRLREAGFEYVYNYEGGYKDWVKSGNVISLD